MGEERRVGKRESLQMINPLLRIPRQWKVAHPNPKLKPVKPNKVMISARRRKRRRKRKNHQSRAYPIPGLPRMDCKIFTIPSFINLTRKNGKILINIGFVAYHAK